MSCDDPPLPPPVVAEDAEVVRGNIPLLAAGLVAALLVAELLSELEGDGRDVTTKPLFFDSRRGRLRPMEEGVIIDVGGGEE